ncbi:MAG: bifunctional hydroxymethylpyrimidine kinase/phosphomethylpyrimidine kinase [Anaerolineae bacterium]|nr:bifunctional hydroxymethylpyrimidine kinase/phosphomethylpyrimidine kinase [Anaerolineae bacterium]
MIFCIGNPVYDFIKTAYLSTETRILSGCSTNACLALSKLGTPSTLVGRVGEDFYDRFISDMERYNIAHHVTLSKETGGFSLVYDETGDRTLDVLGIAEPVSTLPEDLPKAKIVFFGPVLGETPLDLVKAAREKTEAPFVLDPQGLVRRLESSDRIIRYFNPELREILPYFEVVKANEHEAQVITGVNPREDARMAAVKLYEFGCKVAIVTLAEAGSVLFDGRDFYRIPPYATLAKDPTGAGDVYAGSFIFRYLANGGNLVDAAYFASCAASIMVENTGPDFPMSVAEVERRMQTLQA